MSLILVTGISTSGKSTMAVELAKRGDDVVIFALIGSHSQQYG